MITLVLIGFSIEIRVESRNIIYTGHEFNVLVALMCSSLLTVASVKLPILEA